MPYEAEFPQDQEVSIEDLLKEEDEDDNTED